MLHRFAIADLPRTPWKNGGGLTREIACMPPGVGMDGFDWRVSMAHITRDGPFSAFPGVDRVITLLEGAGVHLRSTDGAIDHVLHQGLVPFGFPGDAAIDARLLGPDCHDLNVMTRRAACQAQVQVLRGTHALAMAPHGLLLAVHGSWRAVASDHPTHTLAPQHGLWWHGSPTGWWLAPEDSPQHTEAALLAVTVHPASP